MTDTCAACGLKEVPYLDRLGLCPMCSDDSYQNDAQSNPAGGRASTTTETHNLSKLQLAALDAIWEHGSMRAAAKALGTNHGVISMALDGVESPAAYKALHVRKTPYRTLAFRFYDDAAFERARAAVDAGGDRTEWLLSKIGDDNEL